ncbi:unnamed protein product, partial [Ectocarpus fasciculatus]
MKPSLRFVRLSGLPIFRQLQLEEVLMRHDDQNYCLFNSVPPEAPRSAQAFVVTGLGGKIPELVEEERARRDKVPVIRRYTGGGTVVVDDNTVFVTFIMNKAAHPDVPSFPRNIMDWSTNIYGPVFDGITKNSFEKLQFALRENDYVFGERKIGGNAQAITKDRWVHHTSFLWNFDPENMKYLLMPKKRPKYRADRDHNSFISKISDFGVQIPSFHDGIKQRCTELYDVQEI